MEESLHFRMVNDARVSGKKKNEEEVACKLLTGATDGGPGDSSHCHVLSILIGITLSGTVSDV